MQILIEENKLLAPNFAANPKYISISETNLIRQRGDKSIKVEPFGTMKDYISFYFGVRSPMLYCIWRGYDVKQQPQKDIIYLVSSVERLEELGANYVFTDGHSFAEFTQFFKDKKYLEQVDWRTVRLQQWKDTAEDPDRKRRKSAECLVHKELKFGAIIAIVVYNQEAYDYISSVLEKNKIKIPLEIRPDWYY
ncbi:MAG: DUF4433 domain-containing protein [bacterium]|nr:DUF4433 domain-containing protein [bacterium]